MGTGTTIDTLDIQIKTSAGTAAVNIERLATALGNLKSNGKLTTVVNNLDKLAKSLDNLNKSTSNMNGLSRLKTLGTVLNGLGSVQKLSGLTSVVNTLSKLSKVVAALDAATIDKFKKAMEKLADALSPLAIKLQAVADGFRALPAHLRRAISAVNSADNSINNMGNSINTTSLNTFTMLGNVDMLISGLNAVADAMANVISQAIQWDGVQSRFGRAMADSAEEYYDYIQKINEVMGINVQQFMGNSSLFADMMRGFGVGEKDASTMAIGFTELAYDIWAGTNDVFNTLEEAMDAVRSTIGGETESIQRAGFSVIESTLQETAARHNLAVNIEKATMAEKTYLRYLTLVDQAHARSYVGVYAAEMKTAEGAVRDLSQSFKTLVQAIGSLFIPIVQIVIPYVTAFVRILTDAAHVVAKFFGIELFKIDWSSSKKGVGGLADGATEAATGLTGAAKAAKKLKDYTMGFDELNVISPDTGSGSGGGAGGVGDNGDWYKDLDLDTLWDESVFEQASKRVDEIKEKILKFMEDWKWAFAGVATALAAIAVAKHWSTITGTIGAIIGGISKMTSVVSALFGFIKGQPVLHVLTQLSPKLALVMTAVSTIAGFLGLPVWATIVVILGTIASTAYFLYENWDKVVKVVKDFFKENIVPKFQEIKRHVDNMVEALGPLGKLFSNIGGSVLPILGKAIEIVGGIIVGVVGGTIATAFNILVGIVENMIETFSGVVQIVSGIVSLIVAIFTGGDIGKAWEKIWKGVWTTLKGLVSLIIDPVVDLVDGVITWFKELWDELVGHSIVPDMVNAIVDWFVKMPSRVIKPVKDLVNQVTSAFKNAWSTISSWFKSNVAPKFTKDYWSAKFDTIRSSVTSKLGSAKTAITDKWAEVKKWFTANVAPKFTTSYWGTKFNTIYSGLKTKLDSAWTAVKNFFSATEWKKKVEAAVKAIKDNFKMPSFPKIKLSVEWDTKVGAVKKAVYQALGLDGWPSLKWSTYAQGGFPMPGEYFVARESGPELVGRIGNKPAVANNDQIVAAVSQGVYQAVVSAMSANGGGGNQNVNVYLDGKQIHASVKRTDESRGRNIMGNQLGYLY